MPRAERTGNAAQGYVQVVPSLPGQEQRTTGSIPAQRGAGSRGQGAQLQGGRHREGARIQMQLWQEKGVRLQPRGAAPLALTLIQEKGHARGPPCLSDRSPCPGCRDPLSSQALQGVWRRGLESAPSTAQDLSFTGAPCPRRSRRAGNSRPSRVGRCSHTLAPGCHEGAAGQAQMSRLVASSAKPLAVQVPSPRRERQRLQRCHGGHTS